MLKWSKPFLLLVIGGILLLIICPLFFISSLLVLVVIDVIEACFDLYRYAGTAEFQAHLEYLVGTAFEYIGHALGTLQNYVEDLTSFVGEVINAVSEFIEYIVEEL